MKSRNVMRRQLTTAAASLLLLAGTLGAQADYSNTLAALAPLAYWRLNETVQPPPPDVATNAGTLGASARGFFAGTTTHPVPGALAGSSDSAAGFNGTDGQVTVPFIPALSLNSPFSAEAWVNPGATPGGLTCVLAGGHFANPRSGWLIYQDVNGYVFRLYNQNAGNTSLDIKAGIVPVVGQWYHVVAVYDGTNGYIYVNGAGVSGVPTGFVPNTDGPLTIATRSDNAFYFNGNVDEVAIYTNALSGAEALAHYQNGTNASRVTPYQTLIQTKNPIAYYRLNEPTYTAPDPGTLPLAVSSGSLGASANAITFPGAQPGVPGVPFSGFGVGNLGCAFNGVIGYLDAGALAEFDLLGPLTLVAWVKGNPADSRFKTFFGKSDTSYRMGMDQSGLSRFAVVNDPDVTGTRNINDGQWHQVVGVHDIFGTNYLFVDGILDATGPANATVNSSSAHVIIGSIYDYLNSRVFNGSMDEVAIFDKALSPSQIQQTFFAGNVPARILAQPQLPAGQVFEGYTVPFTVLAAGTPTLAYQWTKNGTNLATRTTSALTLSNVTTNDSGNYAVIVTNAYGSVTSSVVALVVLSGPPQIFQQPQSVTRYAGGPATFTVVAGGSSPLGYQWKLNGSTTIGGATASSYTINNVQVANNGNYSCTITNPYGTTNTIQASLTVIPAPTNAYAQAVLADNPIGYWRLGEGSGTTAFDYASSHNGTYTNVVLGRPGYSINDTNSAAGFGPGINSYVGDISGIDFATNGANATFSLECWVKGPQAQSGDVGILTKGTGAGGEQFNLDTGAGGHYRFFVRDASGNTPPAGNLNSSIFPNNDWQHLVAVCDEPGGSLYFYVNGVQAGTVAAPVNGILSTVRPFSIGSRQSGTAAFDLNWNGSIDEVAVYNTALSAGQVLAHFNARYGSPTKPGIAVQPVSVTNYLNLSATFSVEAGGSDPLTYQWKFNGADIAGATSNVLTIAPLYLTNAGNYTVAISNLVGFTNSAIATLTVLPVPAAVDTSPGLVLHLKFDGDNIDFSGRANNGTNSGPITYVPGKIGSQAVHYATDVGSASYAYVKLGLRPDLQFSSNVNFSVAYWLRYTGTPGDLPILANAVGSTFSFGYVFAPSYQLGGWQWSLYNNSGGGVQGQGADNLVNDGNWHHLVHTFDRNGYGTTYLDGLQVDARPIGGRIGNIDTGQPTNIGQDPIGNYGESGSADLDDLGVWRRVLTPLEVGGMYLAGASNNVSFVSAPVKMSVQLVGNQVQVIWAGGLLQSADVVTGPYTDVIGATSPYTVAPTAARKFYRVRE